LRTFKKLLLSAVATMAIVAGVAASPASAAPPGPTHGRDAESANVPYLAWRGEHVRLGFCDPNLQISSADNVTWSLEDWSGDPANGSVPVPQQIFGAAHINNGCAYTSWVSQKAGAAFIKVEVDAGSDSDNPGADLADKQFIVGWMQLTTPVVTGGGQVNAGDFCPFPVRGNIQSLIRGYFPDPSLVCDPKIDNRHLITATVKGIIPLDANFDEWAFPASGPGSLVTPGQLTLPDDWNAWAQIAARSSAPDHTTADYASNWDIHDTAATSDDSHVITDPLGSQCPALTETSLTTDTVDNCVVTEDAFGGLAGGFSTIFGTMSRASNSIGPFDPLYTNDTMLSDGILDWGDAPMPAAQIDVDIAPNSGGATDTSGVGYLYPSYKGETHSRDGLGDNVAHNLDQPFYYQYIPATSRPIDTAGSLYGAVQPSGVDGGSALGFNGFEWAGGPSGTPYQNWQFAYTSSFNSDSASKCLWYQSANGVSFVDRPLPYGDTNVTVYTDEHGEADVNYVPGLGFYFDNLGAPKNNDGSCDLKNIDPIGSAAITVTARYPYQMVTIGDPSAAPVNFTVHSLFQKTLTVYPKGPSSDDANVRIVVAHAQDIDGSPLENEMVCWTASNVQAIQPFPGGANGGDILDSSGKLIVHIQFNPYTFVNKLGQLCTFTDPAGNTAVEVTNSEKGTADVLTDWINEQVWRDIPVDFSTTAGVVGSDLSDTGPVTHVPTPAQIKAATTAGGTIGPVVQASTTLKTKVIKSHKVTKVIHKIRFARVFKPFHGKRVLQVRVNGKAGMVGLRITVKVGGKKHTYVRYVPANRKLAVPHLPIPVKTAKVTVSLMGL
jgi:hypothetical protein